MQLCHRDLIKTDINSSEQQTHDKIYGKLYSLNTSNQGSGKRFCPSWLLDQFNWVKENNRKLLIGKLHLKITLF